MTYPPAYAIPSEMEHKSVLKYGPRSSEIVVNRESLHTYSPGDRASVRVAVDDPLVREYAETYGDRNPIHLDEQAGRESVFKSRVAHGMLSFNFFSTLLGAGFPGPGTIFVGIDGWRFTAPVKIGDLLNVEVILASARQKSNGAYDLTFDAQAVRQDGTSVMAGRLNVIAPKP